MKRIALLFVLWTGVAAAQPAGSAAAPVPPDTAARPTLKSPRELCAEAMNADPTFAQSILATLGRNVDQETLKAHEDAALHIQKNERHVILAYAAMWVIAAMFVLFMWIRQQALKREIGVLRKDLEAAVKQSK